MFEKTKKFVSDHRGIIIGAAGVIVGAVATAAGIKYRNMCTKEKIMKDGLMGSIYKVLHDIPNSTQVIGYTDIIAEGFTPDDLGLLGAKMFADGAEATDKFTHFIAIGKV